jgi:hypothetical protein
MPLVEDDHLVQALAPDTPKQPLDVGVVPGTLWSDQHVFATPVPTPLSKGGAVDLITSASEILWSFDPGKRFTPLLCCPRRRRMLRDVAMHHLPPLVGQDHQHEQELLHHGGHRKAIQSIHVLDVVCQAGLPRR